MKISNTKLHATLQWTTFAEKSPLVFIKNRWHIYIIFFNLFFQSPPYENFTLSEYYTYNFFTSRVVMSSDYQRRDSGFHSQWHHWSFFYTASYYVVLHFYLQQPGIIKIFLLYNIPGKVPLFFWNKQDIMRVNCTQNVTKYYILLRNVAHVLKVHNSVKRMSSVAKLKVVQYLS
jgi:hypothetical protein